MVRERKRGHRGAGQGHQGQPGMRQTIQPNRVKARQELQVSGTRLGGAELTGWGSRGKQHQGQGASGHQGQTIPRHQGHSDSSFQGLSYRLSFRVEAPSLPPLIIRLIIQLALSTYINMCLPCFTLQFRPMRACHARLRPHVEMPISHN